MVLYVQEIVYCIVQIVHTSSISTAMTEHPDLLFPGIAVSEMKLIPPCSKKSAVRLVEKTSNP